MSNKPNDSKSLGLLLPDPDVVLDRTDWLTINRYAERHGLTTDGGSNKLDWAGHNPG